MTTMGMVAMTTTAMRGGQSFANPPAVRKKNRPMGKRVVVRVGQEDDRPEEAVPGPLELEDRHRRQRRSGERQHDLPERREEPRPVDAGGLLELAWHRQEELAHQEDARGGDGQQDDDRHVLAQAARQADGVHDQVHGHEPELVGDHQRGQHDEEEQLAAREPQSREGVAGDAAEDEVGDRHDDGDDRAVEEQDRQRRLHLVPGVLPRLPA